MFRSDLLQQFPLFIGDSVKESKGMALGKTVAVVFFILGLLFFDNIWNKRQTCIHIVRHDAGIPVSKHDK